MCCLGGVVLGVAGTGTGSFVPVVRCWRYCLVARIGRRRRRIEGGVWSSDADSDGDADGDPDGVRECRCRWSSTCTVSHVGSLNPRMRFAQQKSGVKMSSVGSSLRNCSMVSPECIQVVLSGRCKIWCNCFVGRRLLPYGNHVGRVF